MVNSKVSQLDGSQAAGFDELGAPVHITVVDASDTVPTGGVAAYAAEQQLIRATAAEKFLS